MTSGGGQVRSRADVGRIAVCPMSGFRCVVVVVLDTLFVQDQSDEMRWNRRLGGIGISLFW